MVAEDCDGRQAKAHQYVQQRLHFLRAPIVGEIACNHKNVCFVSDAVQLIMQRAQPLGSEMQIGCGCNSHKLCLCLLAGGPPSWAPVACLRNLCVRNPLCRSSNPQSFMSIENMFSSTRLPRKGALGSFCCTSCR